jgi:phosphoribosylformylglycinamidine cyclo-ligase
MEIYTDEQTAKEIIKISQEFGVEAQIVGRVEEGEKSVEIYSPYGVFTY